MASESKFNSRAVGCILQLLGFAALVVAFMALVFFLFRGLSFYLGGEEIEVPEFSAMWNFIDEKTDEFFNQINDGLDETEDDTAIVLSDGTTVFSTVL